jgi:hypothetical protein
MAIPGPSSLLAARAYRSLFANSTSPATRGVTKLSRHCHEKLELVAKLGRAGEQIVFDFNDA